MGFPQKGPKFDGKLSSNRHVHKLKEKDVYSSVFSKKVCFPKQNARENARLTRPLRRNPRDFWRLGPALLGRAAGPNCYKKSLHAMQRRASESKRMGDPS